MISSFDQYGAAVGSRYAHSGVPEAERTADTATDCGDGFFGTEGPCFRDALDAINPLNHIPIVSGALEDATGHHVSTGAKLIGGALLGGPIGLVAGLVNAVFEQATGKGAVESMVAALSGDSEPDTQLAQNSASEENQAVAIAERTEQAAPVQTVEASQKLASVTPAGLTASAPVQVASLDLDRLQDADKQAAKDQAVLALFGSSEPSAHRSYRNAQMRSYLQDVSVSKTI